MKLIYKGKFNGDPSSIPCKEHQPGAVRFKEMENMKIFGILMNILAFLTALLLFVVLFLRAGTRCFSFLGCICSLIALFPHELLHAICFKEEVYLYTNFANGMLFVTGPETMSKGRFIFMSLLPNIVFGLIPFIIFLCNPGLSFFGTFGALSISMGVGDYYNIFNALTQVPKGARTYLHQWHSYWYIPEK